ncbi:ribosome-associated translation inhibitor RaiA [Proteiniborus sp. MB09-C3]|uniref:ribosome hibernation-promoting factor, HPF/YfiA family n=1 Tax=Proteiniborus sp. MB09-C3 TaxID=3050072 RepID=UPI00255215A2|nr:ribosome-associated translation inhibitor RaiA [Proteiniborus sp. MB09-C3]WIV12014.1 ribosome-associated translation inhibitor RaiA [Proteiniborus sp. MB09-C3]
MKITISGKNMVVTDALRDVIEKKMGKLDKYFYEDVPVYITLSVEKNRQIIEVTIPFSGAIIRAEESTDDMYQSIDRVVDVLERQVRKHKTKLQKKNKGLETIRFENVQALPAGENGKEASIVRTKRFAMKPMDAEEAVLQMELLRHAFYVFRNAESDEVNIVYRRKDGNYGLIEPEY